tara:strand:+ start:474 stop:662 length:189 start_codon:yes stop_codon:yes gene_type:complete
MIKNLRSKFWDWYSVTWMARWELDRYIKKCLKQGKCIRCGQAKEECGFDNGSYRWCDCSGDI